MRKVFGVLLCWVVITGCGADDPSVKTEPNVPRTTVTPSEEAVRTSPPTTKAPAAVGSTITLRGQNDGEQLDVTVTNVVNPAPPGRFGRPDGKYVAVQLKLVNVGSAVYSDSPSNGAKLVDGDHQQFNTTIADSGAGPGFAGGSVTLAPGETRVGYLTFDVPATAVPVAFQFALNSGFAPEKGQWQLG